MITFTIMYVPIKVTHLFAYLCEAAIKFGYTFRSKWNKHDGKEAEKKQSLEILCVVNRIDVLTK